MIKYYLRCIKWLWKHRVEENCRQKWRRTEREVGHA
jgi:hypothetical protein